MKHWIQLIQLIVITEYLQNYDKGVVSIYLVTCILAVLCKWQADSVMTK